MKLPAIAIKYSQFTIVVFLFITVMGVISYFTMPKSEDPFIKYNASIVTVINPGATPENMEALISDPIEEAINEIEGIKTISSTINNGALFLFAEYEFGLDYDEKHRELVQKVNEIRDELPETIYKIDLRQPSVLDVAIMQFALTGKDASPASLKQTADKLKHRIERISGVRGVEIIAAQKLELQIVCDFDRMAHHNISLNNVVAILQNENRSIPGGSIDIGQKKFNVNTSGMYEDLVQIENTVIHAGNGLIIKLKDIARVEFNYKANESFARYNGENAVWLTVKQKQGQNIYTLTKNILNEVDAFKSERTQEVEIHEVVIQEESVKKRVNQFVGSFLQGMVLVGFIVFLAMGGLSALIVMLVIPVCVLAGVGIIDFNGFGLQQMTIAGLIISLGMLVDNSIAVVENIYRYLRKGLKPVDAAIKGASEISTALMSSTLTTLLAFMPMLMLGNEVGDFIKSMILIIIYTLSVSLIAALFLTPFLGSKILRIKPKNKTRIPIVERFIERYYDKWLNRAIKRPGITIIIALIIFIGSASLMPLIGVSFFPKAEKEQILVYINTPEGNNLESTNKAVTYVEEVLKCYPEIASVSSTIGESNPQLYYNMIIENPADNLGCVFAIVEGDYSSEKMTRIIQDLRKEFKSYPNAKIEVKEFAQGPPVNAPIEIRLYSDNLVQLKEIASDVERMYNNTPGLLNINNPIAASKSDLKVKINREKAGMYGVLTPQIDRTVRAIVNGVDIGDYRDNLGEKYGIVLKSDNDDGALAQLNKSYVSSVSGTQVKMENVADITFEGGYKQITHYNRKRFVAVSADVNEDIQSIAMATKAVSQKLDSYEWPEGTYFEVGGEEESRDNSFGGMSQALLIALLGIFGVLVLQFKSFRQPLIIFSAIPLSITGAFLGLLLSGYSFSFMAFVGLTSLMGVVINASIIQVDYANQLRNKGLELKEAIILAAKTRFNPIMLTTITTIGGLLPLTLRGGDMWAPMGWAIIGGLIVSTSLTLLLVPVLYTVFSSKKTKFIEN
jgi:multidrug efflux pump subunit AcrB